MHILFIPGQLAGRWELPPQTRATCLDDIPVRSPEPMPDIVVLSSTLANAALPTDFPRIRILIDSADRSPSPADVKTWLKAGFRDVILSQEERRVTDPGLLLPHTYELIGEHPAMRKVEDQIRKVAPSNVTVLIRGESGTGKELVARALHRLSRRSDGPFVPVNCAAIPDTLLEDDLFGHVKGAFTDASTDRIGKVAAANGGTLFLDEIGDMPASLQVKLLRMLQEREIQPLGAQYTRKVDIRVVAATASNLEKNMEQGTFRRDLYYRLNVVPITLPPLRDRRSDIPILIRHFIRDLSARHGLPEASVDPDAMHAMTQYRWPGNVRELQHMLERTLVLASDPTRIRLQDLPSPLNGEEES